MNRFQTSAHTGDKQFMSRAITKQQVDAFLAYCDTDLLITLGRQVRVVFPELEDMIGGEIEKRKETLKSLPGWNALGAGVPEEGEN